LYSLLTRKEREKEGEEEKEEKGAEASLYTDGTRAHDWVQNKASTDD
jgi:hypothetical protein